RVGLARYAQAEHEVTWMNELGTLHDKTERLVALSELLAKMVTALPCHKAVDLAALRRAATLAKADLLSKVVREKEYTSLQGIIGGVYALAAGESQVAAKAIEEHYLPRNLGDPLPSTSEGRILSFVDKLDNACAAFAIGAGPTGSEDPYAVRRQVTALLNLVLDSGWRVNLRELIDANLGMMPDSRPELRTQISQFVKDRLGLLLGDKGMAYDIVNAVIDLAWSDPQDALVRGQALADARQKSDFERLVIGQKRVANILKAGSQGQARDTVSSETGAATRAGESVSCQESCVLQPGLLVESAEQMLYQGAQALAEPLAQSCGAQDYRQAMELLLTLRPLIDEFFDQVLVMCPDQRLSANRLALLRFVSSLFGQVADLSQIVI
ncbi:MAG: glycine--tRNA ligase subunit beta, partial [candidate division WOR-3 bacterium]